MTMRNTIARAGGILILALALGISASGRNVPSPPGEGPSGSTAAPPESLLGDPPRWSPDSLPEVLPLEPEVRDPVFAILIGLVESGVFGSVSRERLEREVARSGRPTKLPIEHLEEIRRSSRPGRNTLVRLVSTNGLDLAVPYRILVYHPGSLRATREVVLEEWNLGTLHLNMGGQRDGPPILLEDVRLWGLRRGRLELDVDGWLDSLMGGRLDDTRIVGFALFRHHGELMGLAMGYNKEGQGRSGSFSFREDRILFPNPAPFKTAAIYLRGRLEQLVPGIAAFRRS